MHVPLLNCKYQTKHCGIFNPGRCVEWSSQYFHIQPAYMLVKTQIEAVRYKALLYSTCMAVPDWSENHPITFTSRTWTNNKYTSVPLLTPQGGLFKKKKRKRKNFHCSITKQRQNIPKQFQVLYVVYWFSVQFYDDVE